jgi:8-oxo-dGTP diphosphatase
MSGRSLVGCPCSNSRMHKVAVGALVREGRVLLVHRSPNKRAYPDVWDLPGGVIEAGESELVAFTRELHEERGVQIATGSASHLCRLTAGPAEEPALLSAWLMRDWQGTPANVAPEEHDDIGWFGVEESARPRTRAHGSGGCDTEPPRPNFNAVSSDPDGSGRPLAAKRYPALR